MQQLNSFIFSTLYFYLLIFISRPPDVYSNRAELRPAFADAKIIFIFITATYFQT